MKEEQRSLRLADKKLEEALVLRGLLVQDEILSAAVKFDLQSLLFVTPNN